MSVDQVLNGLKGINKYSQPSLEVFMQETAKLKDYQAKLFTFIDKLESAESIKNKLWLIVQSTKQNPAILHFKQDSFNAVNIMTLFVVGLFELGDMKFSEWIDITELDKEFETYVFNFLKHIDNPSTMIISQSKPSDIELPSDTTIPNTLCVTDSMDKKIDLRKGNICTLDILDIDSALSWNQRVLQKETITSVPMFWYVYVTWRMNDHEQTGCYGIQYDNNYYFYLYLPRTNVDEEDLEVFENADETLQKMIKTPYNAYISCMDDLSVRPDTKLTEIVSIPQPVKFKYNILLYIHLFVLGYFKDDKIIFFVCHDNNILIEDALLAGKKYSDFQNALQPGINSSLMLQTNMDDNVTGKLACAYLDLMMTRDNKFESIGTDDSNDCHDKFITTCPVQYDWVFKKENLSRSDIWKQSVIFFVDKIESKRATFHEIAIMRRIIRCMNIGLYEYVFRARLGIFFRYPGIGMFADRLGYVVFNFKVFAEEQNIYNSSSSIQDFCHSKELLVTIAKQYFGNHWHYCDFEHKYVLWKKESLGDVYTIKDSCEVEVFELKGDQKLTDTELNQFPFCPFCKQYNEDSKKLADHIRTSHDEQYSKIMPEISSIIPTIKQDQTLEGTGAVRKPINFGVDISTLAPITGRSPGGRAEGDTPGSVGGSTPASQKSYEYNSEREEELKALWSKVEEGQRKRSEESSGEDSDVSRPPTSTASGTNEGRPSSSIVATDDLDRPRSGVDESGSENRGSTSSSNAEPTAEIPKPTILPEIVNPSTPTPPVKPPTPPLPAVNLNPRTPSQANPAPVKSPTPELPPVSKTPGTRLSTASNQPKSGSEFKISKTKKSKGIKTSYVPNVGNSDIENEETGINESKKPETVSSGDIAPVPEPPTDESHIVSDLKVSNETHHGNDREKLDELLTIVRLHENRLEHQKEIIEELEEDKTDLTNSKVELVKKNQEQFETNKDLNKRVQELTEEIDRQNTEHARKIQELSAQKDKQIADLQAKLTEEPSQKITALSAARETMEKQNQKVMQEIVDNKVLLEKIRKEIRENERKRDEDMTKIDAQIDRLFKMDIDESDWREYLIPKEGGDPMYSEFKDEVLDENPTTETHSLCALFLMYESIAGTWKLFMEQKEKGNVDDIMIQKLIHELRLYDSIENHNANVKKVVSKHFRDFVQAFEMESNANRTDEAKLGNVGAEASNSP